MTLTICSKYDVNEIRHNCLVLTYRQDIIQFRYWCLLKLYRLKYSSERLPQQCQHTVCRLAVSHFSARRSFGLATTKHLVLSANIRFSDASRKIQDVKKNIVKWPRVQPRFSRRRHADPRPVRRGQNQNYAGDGLWTTLIVRKAM